MKPERRRFPRIGEAVKIQYRSSGQLGTSWHTATIVNFSAGGVRFRVEEPLERLAAVAVQIVFPGARSMMELQGQVVWNQMQASGVMSPDERSSAIARRTMSSTRTMGSAET